MKTEGFLRLTPGQATTPDGLLIFRLALWVFQKPGQPAVEIDHVWAVSGAPGCQELVRAADRRPGSGYPTPEGLYLLGDSDAIDRINWASGVVGDYSGTWGDGLGPVWVGIHPAPGNKCRSFDFGIHEDDNWKWSPGSDGCTTIQPDLAAPDKWVRMKRVVSWFRSYSIPRYVVDFSLGTVPRPALIKPKS